MYLLRCTKRLQKEMGLNLKSKIDLQITSWKLYSWHANLIFIQRRKCVLFVNDKTLFNFIVPDVSRAQIKDLARLFTLFLSCVIGEEDIPNTFLERIMAGCQQIEYANTNSKSVIASMNDLAYHYQHSITLEGGIHGPKVPGIIKNLNRMPMGALGYAFPIDVLNAIYSSET